MSAASSSATAAPAPPKVLKVAEHTVEIVSDSGEGAQKCAQIFAAVSAKMGNGVWTVELIPAEIQPPPRVPEGASGNRVRIGEKAVTNWGDRTNLVIAFNEQVLLARHRLDALADDAVLLVEDKWARSDDPEIVAAWAAAMKELSTRPYRIVPVAMEDECLTIVDNPKKGKNMFALGILARIYGRDMDRVREQIAFAFRKKSEEVYAQNVALLELGYHWAEDNIDFRVEIPTHPAAKQLVVMNGNEAIAMGAIAAGMELCAMYPITPATSVSHLLSEIFERFGGMVHQAEDEIAACGVAIGASYAGKVALTVTSGPGLALKTEFLGLAIMTEVPLVLVDVQRGGPSTGQPTKVEQGDLLTAIYGSHGDAPKVVLAVSGIEDCFYSMITARKIAETFNMVVVVLSDASLSTAQAPFPRPKFSEDWLAPPIDQSPLPEGAKPYDWDPVTGIARRFIPGQPGGMHTVTGLAHDRASKVAYDPQINEESLRARSLKLAALQKTLKAPAVYGAAEGDLLVVGWGSTKGVIEEAVDRMRAEGLKVSSLHLRFIQPMPSGIGEIMRRFGKVIAVEGGWGDRLEDELIDADNRRYTALAMMLRSRYLVDVDCWSEARGQPIKPGNVVKALRAKLEEGK